MKIEEKILVNEISNRNRVVFESSFREYYFILARFAEGFVFDHQVAEDIVQNTFLYFWENTDKIQIETSLKSYLYQSVKNRCLNYLRDLHVEDKHHFLYFETRLNNEDTAGWDEVDLSDRMQTAIDSLPPQQKELFTMKYVHGVKNTEIARINKISLNTLQTQLRRAKEKLREKLAGYISYLFF